MLLARRLRKEYVLVLRSAATKISNTSKPGDKQKDEKYDHQKREEPFDDKQAAVLLSGTKNQEQFDENVSFQWMRNGKIPIDYHGNKLEL